MAVYILLWCMKGVGSLPSFPDLWAPLGAWRRRSHLRRHPSADVAGQSGSASGRRFGVQPTGWETRDMQARYVYDRFRPKWAHAVFIVKIRVFLNTLGPGAPGRKSVT